MTDQDKDQDILLKRYLEENSGTYNPEQSLSNALKAAKTKNASRDILTLFTAWIWVLFAGFGVSIHTEITKRMHSSPKKDAKKTN
jgi:bacteriorhodopsin